MKIISVFLVLFVLLQGLTFPSLAVNSFEQYGINRYNHEVPLSAGATDVAVGTRHACATTGDGAVLCWGANWAAQLGNGTWSESLIPIKVIDLNGASKLVSGDNHTCALVTGGGIKCWGINGEGELGDGFMYWASPTPVNVVGLSIGVVDLASGYMHTCAITSTGGVKCWGI